MLFFLLFFHKSAAFLEQTIVGWKPNFRNISFSIPSSFAFIFHSFRIFNISLFYKKLNIPICSIISKRIVPQCFRGIIGLPQKLHIYFLSPVKYKKGRFELHMEFPEPVFLLLIIAKRFGFEMAAMQ